VSDEPKPAEGAEPKKPAPFSDESRALAREAIRKRELLRRAKLLAEAGLPPDAVAPGEMERHINFLLNGTDIAL
jgi:hypothetical protein